MRLILQIITTLVIIAYPLAVYFGLQYLPAGTIALLLCLLLLMRFMVTKQQVKSMTLPILIGIGLTAASFIAQRNDWLLYYPVVIILSMLGLFGYSLINGPSMIERLARLKEPDLPDSAIPYLQTITKLWCGLFVVNGAVATYTAKATSIEIWTLYNGLIAYLFMGMLLSGEWIYRRFWLKNMNKLLLNWLSTGPASQQLISFDHHDIMTGSLFCAHVAHLHAQLTQSAAKRWLLAAKHSDLFAAGLCAALLAGKQVILPANTQSGTLSQLNHEFDAIIADTPLCEVGEYIALKKELSLPAAKWPKSESLGELILFTSGSSGQPKAVKKTLQQLDAEVSILEQTFAEHLPHCSVVSTVSHQHIYGLLFKVLWPLAASRAFLSEQIDFPETLSYYLAIMPNLCLISSPAQLTRLPDALDNQKQQRIPSLIFSSGGPLNFDAAQAVKQCFYQFPIEIFGSTETGGIAYRRQQQPLQPWQAFTQVNIDIDPQDGALMLQSVYLDNQAQWLRCDDKIELLTDGQFRLLHRLDRIVKIEEKRLSLAQVEHLLQTHPFVREAAVTVLEQPRTMLGAAICLSELGLKTLEAEGKLALNNALKNHLLSQFERITLPRRWRYPAHLPLNSQGKRTQAEIIALFSHD